MGAADSARGRRPDRRRSAGSKRAPAVLRVVAGIALVLGTGTLVNWPVPASAHAELESAVPAVGSVLTATPGEVRLLFTEAPATGSTVRVLDGCGSEVVAAVRVQDRALVASLRPGAGRPGDWQVRYETLADGDGHQVGGDVRFHVSGDARCGDASAAPVRTDAQGMAEGGSGGVVPLALGATALLGGALLVRARARARAARPSR